MSKFSKTKTISQADNKSVSNLSIPFPKRLFIEIVEGQGKGNIVEITTVRWVIGRTDADLEIADDKVSKKHAVIEAYATSNITIRDLASTNGTFVNGVQINQKKIKSGDMIRVGDTQFRLFSADRI